MAKKIIFSNFKGGVGKTTNSVMLAYELAKQNFKTLVIDLDPQSNSTQLISRTYTKQQKETLNINKSMMLAIQEKNLRDAIVNIMPNLFLLPSHKDFVEYPDFLELTYLPNQENYKEKRINHFKQLLNEIEHEYDYIIIDCPPTISIFTDTALYISDFIVIVLQTQQRSLDGAEAFWEYAQTFYNKYSNVDFDIAGILPVIMKNDSGIDNQIIKDAENTFGENRIFNNIIKHMERLKRYDREGIADSDYTEKSDFHDKKVHAVYQLLADEIIKRVEDN